MSLVTKDIRSPVRKIYEPELTDRIGGWRLRFVVTGNPVSQKNTKRAGVSKKGKLFTYSPARIAKYKADAYKELVGQRNQMAAVAPMLIFPITIHVVAEYRIYRSDHRLIDQGNATEAVWDALQAAGIVENDYLIIPRALGPIEYDKQNPRIEVTLQPYSPQGGPSDVAKSK